MQTSIYNKLIAAFLLFCAIPLVAFKPLETNKTLVEKVYTQTDRSLYFPGETIWFKSYVTKTDHTVSSLSDYLNAELISPKGVVIKKIKLSVENGYAYGDFSLKANWVGGIYTLKTYTNWMRNYGENAFFTKKITVQKIVKPNLLLKLKFEKEGYGKSSEVTANFEVKDLKNNPLKHKAITFEVTAKGIKLLSKSTTTNAEGKVKPTFVLPKDLKTTDVVLNVLIPHNGTTESISRSVPVVLDTIDLQFFPESGKTLAGTTNNIAFKALNEFGKPVDISGDIIDHKGNTVTTFKSFHDGMGVMAYLAKSNTSYYAKIKTPFVSERQIKLPEAHKKGVKFTVQHDSLKTTLKIFRIQKGNLHLKVANATKVLITKALIPSEKSINVNTQNFPIGITKFSIVNDRQEVQAERLVFLNAHKKLNINIELDKSVYKTREKVKATITTTDHNNNPVPSNLSVAIADNKLLSFADDKQDHILSYLLLSSELKGKIHKPSFYFNPEEPKSLAALDYLMLTHGWRNYIKRPHVSLENAQYIPEQNSIQYGTITDKKGKAVSAHLLLFDSNSNKVLTLKSDEKGAFKFKTAPRKRFTLLAYTDDGKKLNIIKGKREKLFAPLVSNSRNKKNSFKPQPYFKNNKPLKKPIKQKVTANIALTEDVSSLDEVVVVGYGTAKKSELTGAVSQVRTEDISSIEDVATALQGRVAGVQISNGFPGNTSKILIRGVASITGNNTPLYVVDGVISEENSLSNIHPSQINEISVLKDVSATAIYGCRASNGVVLVTTKYGKSYGNWNKKKLNNTKFNNYAVQSFNDYRRSDTYISKQFYIPQYTSKAVVEERTDFRQTIYWNPVVQTDENGKATFEFYNSDAITSFKIMAEGIGYNGLVGKQDKTYATKKLLNVDFKAPNYMALNDKVILPVSITNESANDHKVQLEVKLPKHLKLHQDFKSQVKIKAHSTIIENITVIPISKAEDATIEISVSSKKHADIVRRKATIISPYFPTEVSISGSKSKSYNFNMEHVVDGSITAQLNIYTNIIGDLMNGIEGMIRKPYGCFEQTSSATYPNIMVLKYLKETGTSNPEIEAKAMDFIKKGYRRLVSFETRKGGFEWFGGTPPHETLTAYGILEFTEMKEVYNGVDRRMLDRTVKWLLNQRDGKGGFNKSKKGYSSFTSSPKDVANAYIVYALSEAKIKANFTKEYLTAYHNALESNDTYKMALLALTSYNLNEDTKATVLLNKIKANIEAYGFTKLPVKNTITRSYGDSKNIETVALSLLALMKNPAPNDMLIAKGIEYLVGKRKYNRFGATQSTVMTLKALIKYTRIQKRKIITDNDTVDIVINGKRLTEKLRLNDSGKIEINNIGDYLVEGQQNFKIHFNTPENTYPYALDITWDSNLPDSSKKCPLALETVIAKETPKVGDNVSMTINITNKKDEGLGMVTAIIGVPSGTTPQPWQLKETLEQNKVAYYEIFDNYLVFYWREFKAEETKTIRLDLKADIAGTYKAPASTAYLYYGDEFKTWISGNTLEIKN